MREKINNFELLLNRLSVAYSTHSIVNFEKKPSKISWSKKETLGHLIDSAQNNIQRFTEIQYFEKPYKIRQYKPDELVKANDYQNKENQDLFDLWLHLNRHILHLVKLQTQESLQFQLLLPSGELSDLKFLIDDYFNHFNHHINQITDTTFSNY